MDHYEIPRSAGETINVLSRTSHARLQQQAFIVMPRPQTRVARQRQRTLDKIPGSTKRHPRANAGPLTPPVPLHIGSISSTRG